MPIYEYQCTSCGACFELLKYLMVLQKCALLAVIRKSGKLLSKVGFQLKGTGWYETDFKNKKNSKKSDKTDTKNSGNSTSQKKAEASDKQKSNTSGKAK